MSLPTVAWFRCALKIESGLLSGTTSLGPISIDTRTIQPGDTFWALVSERDGHEFVADSFAKGAKAAVVSATFAATVLDSSFADRLIAVPDTGEALTQAATAWRTELKSQVIGITGTNGKTSTKDLILNLLASKFRTSATQGNLNNEIGVPLTLLATPDDSEILIVEMGASHAGEIADLCNICQPTHGLVTSIGRAHLAGFGSIASVARTKGALYDFVADHGIAFVPTDDELCRIEAADVRHRIGYGFGLPAIGWDSDYHQGAHLSYNESAQATFVFEKADFTVGTPGRPAAITALAALTVAHHFGIPLSDCQRIVGNWRGVHGRSGVLRFKSVTVLDDSYNANPNSMNAALETLSLMKASRRVAVLGDMNELGDFAVSEHAQLGRSLKRYGLDLGLFVGQYAETAAFEARNSGVNSHAFPTVEALEPLIIQMISEGDAVLVKGSRSMRMERVVELIKKAFA